MTVSTPLEAVSNFVAAMNRGDVEAAVSHYETSGVFVAEPGVFVAGSAAIQEALAGMLAMKPRLSTASHEVFISDDLALYHSQWTMSGTRPDGGAVMMTGHSCDVLRRQVDGQWKVAIDNPWGTAVLDSKG